MAEVTQDIEARIDRYLDYLFDEWENVPIIADERPDLGDSDRSDFTEEWGIKEDRLHQLQDYADRGLLNPGQCARHQVLLELVAKTRPLLAPLFEG